MDEHIYPNEKAYAEEINSGDRWQPLQLIEKLKEKAKTESLWNLFLPEVSGLVKSRIRAACRDYGQSYVGERSFQLFRAGHGKYGSSRKIRQLTQQKNEWLKPLLNGEIRSCFAMTEPDVASSDATNIRSSIKRDGDDYVLNGRKWWSTGAGDERCKVGDFYGKNR